MDSSHLGWEGLTLKGYQYSSQQPKIPPMRDYMIVVYRDCQSTMRRRSGGKWETGVVGRGAITLATRCEESEWHWTDPIDVRHIYLNHEALLKTAEEVFEKNLSEIQVRDIVSSQDSDIPIYLNLLEMEVNNQGIGDSLFIDALRTQLCIHTLRNYARLSFQDTPNDGLSRIQRKTVLDYIEAHLHQALKIDELAAQVGLSSYHFARRFKIEIGMTPHGYVLNQRVERVKRLINNTSDRLCSIAVDCGFSDQSHMTRVFKKRAGQSPGEYRRLARTGQR